MSVVTVQLGQCGNQVGYELFDTISGDAQLGHRKEFSAASCERFFHQTARGGELPGFLGQLVTAHLFTCGRASCPQTSWPGPCWWTWSLKSSSRASAGPTGPAGGAMETRPPSARSRVLETTGPTGGKQTSLLI